MRKMVLLLFVTLSLIAGNAAFPAAGYPLGEHGKVAPASGGSAGSPCSFLDAGTVSKITGLHITKVKPTGDSCVYVDPTAPVSAIVQQLGQALSLAFSGESPLRLKAAPGGVPEPQSGAGVIVRAPSGIDVSNVNVHDYVEGLLADAPPDAHCGALRDVSGLNAVSIVCMDGAIGHGGVVKDNRLVQVMYLAPGKSATNTIVGRLVRAAAARM